MNFGFCVCANLTGMFFRKKNKNKTKKNSSASLSIRVFHFSAHARTHADFYYLCEVKSSFSVEAPHFLAGMELGN